MTTHPIGPRSSLPPWSPGYQGDSGSPTCNRAYLLAGVRTGLIALVLLTILVGIVLL